MPLVESHLTMVLKKVGKKINNNNLFNITLFSKIWFAYFSTSYVSFLSFLLHLQSLQCTQYFQLAL